MEINTVDLFIFVETYCRGLKKMYVYVDIYSDGSLFKVRTLCIYGDKYILSSYFHGFTTTHKIHDNWFTTNGYVHIFQRNFSIKPSDFTP